MWNRKYRRRTKKKVIIKVFQQLIFRSFFHLIKWQTVIFYISDDLNDSQRCRENLDFKTSSLIIHQNWNPYSFLRSSDWDLAEELRINIWWNSSEYLNTSRSSANRKNLMKLITLWISLINVGNSGDDKSDPCKIPDFIINLSDRMPKHDILKNTTNMISFSILKRRFNT